MTPRPIRFFHQGALRSVQGPAPTTTVLQWLREQAHCTGSKEGCAEGDCGACTVLVGELDTTHEAAVSWRAVNACLKFLPTLDGQALMTVDDLPQGQGLHPVQQALVECHGSQCGFCTPGFVMSLMGVYLAHRAAGTRPSRAELTEALAGNLCRCTGYRPILDAGERMFDLPQQDLTPAGVLRALQSLKQDPALHYQAPNPAYPVNGAPRPDTFHAPRRLEELAALRLALPEARLLAGGTDVGLWVNKQFRDLGTIIHVGGVTELKQILPLPFDGRPGLWIGSAVPLEAAWAALAEAVPSLRSLWKRFAAPPVRHAGTLGGNVANGSPIGDGAPALIALGADIVLRQGSQQRRLPLQDFYLGYMRNALQPGEFVEAVHLPLPDMATQVRGYKISKRHDSDISAVCAVLSMSVDASGTVQAACFAFGGMAAIVRRAALAEGAVLGQPWNEATVAAAALALAQDFQPLSDLRASAGYRLRVAQNLLRRFGMQTGAAGTSTGSVRTEVWGTQDDLMNPVRAEPVEALRPQPPQRAARAEPVEAPAEHSEHRSPPHESAHLHVSGSAPYTDDLPELAGTLHAAIGCSPVAHGRLLGIDVAALKALPGVVAVFTAQDIPGANQCGAIVADEPILAEGELHYLGQPVFLVVATDRELARRAAARAKDVIRCEALTAILSAQEAHAAGKYVVPPMQLQRGDATTALAQAPHTLQGSFQLGGQEQFYLEGQISYALPREDRGLLLHCSTQHPSEMQHQVAHALGWASHAVQVQCRRMGGGFGGKESQSALFACLAAVAATKLNRPVKLRLDRDDDFMITGRRHGFDYRYEAGFDEEGRLLALDLEMVANAGWSADLPAPVMTRALCHVDNAYWLPHLALRGYCARTNTQSNTAFRGFGGPQGALITELILDSIARRLGRDPLAVRQLNFYARDMKLGRHLTPYGQPVEHNLLDALVSRLVQSSDYAQRRQAVAGFNAQSPVLKKGLALTPVKFGIAFNVVHLNQAGALVHVYTDGSVLVNHGGTEMGQGLNTKVAQVVAQTLGVPLARVRCTATDTQKIANTSATAASTGSDLNGRAAQDAAQRIRQRLDAFAATLPGGSALTFDALVAQAYLARVPLWSEGFYATPGLSWDRQTLQGQPFQYFAFGAAVSEVLVDTLTGESRLLRADLLHDAGRSLNPALDIGQVEGAFIQGMGWLTSEELVWQAQADSPQAGRLLTHAPSTYKIPTAQDCPPLFHTALFDEPNAADTVGRSKAVGEPPLLLAFSVLLALRDAVSAVGGHRVDPPLRAPATPEAILDAVDAVRRAGAEAAPCAK